MLAAWLEKRTKLFKPLMNNVKQWENSKVSTNTLNFLKTFYVHDYSSGGQCVFQLCVLSRKHCI